MFQKMNTASLGLSKMDVLLMVLSCVTIGALYAAFVN